jgi:hypothetical protein
MSHYTIDEAVVRFLSITAPESPIQNRHNVLAATDVTQRPRAVDNRRNALKLGQLALRANVSRTRD